MANPLREGRVCFVGCGKMGGAMLSGWMASEDPLARALCERGFDVIVPHEERAFELKERYGVRTHESAAAAPSDASLIILAVKPQVMDEVLAELATSPAFANGCPLVISIAAGVPCARIQEALFGAAVVRVMPNMPLLAQEGATVVARGAQATQADAEFVNGLFCALGTSQIVEEGQIDAVCALSGGGPAYFAFLAESLGRAGVEAGLDPSLAEALARQTLAGTGAYLAQGDATLAELRASVCSPGGTTLAALGVMEDGLEVAALEGVAAAIARAKELSAC